MDRVIQLNSQVNALFFDRWPSTAKFEAEIVAMAASTLGGDRETISWTAVDDSIAVGAVKAGDLTVEAKFCFDKEGRLIGFRGDRYRIDESGAELTGWATPITDHARFDAIEVPSRSTARWTLG